MKVYLILICQLPLWVVGQPKNNMKHKRLIDTNELYTYMEQIGYHVDTDENLPKDSIIFYALDNGEFAVCGSVKSSYIFVSKEAYLSHINMSEDGPKIIPPPKYDFPLDQVFEQSDIYIDQLAKTLALPLTQQDTFEDLKKLDTYFLNDNIELFIYDFEPIIEQLFAYFARTIANEKNMTNYEYKIDEEDEHYFYFINTDTNKKYEVYQEFLNMILSPDEYFSFYTRAGYIFTTFRLKVAKRNFRIPEEEN